MHCLTDNELLMQTQYFELAFIDTQVKSEV